MARVICSRLLIVSNRRPVIAEVADGDVRLSDADGGLAPGLRPYHENSARPWIGWPGDVARLTPGPRRDLVRPLSQRTIVPRTLACEAFRIPPPFRANRQRVGLARIDDS